MEGASWVAKKSQMEAERHNTKMVNLVNEFEERTRSSVKDPMINDYDGHKVEENAAWIKKEISYESKDLN